MIKKQIPLYTVLIAFLAGGLLQYSFFHNSGSPKIKNNPTVNSVKEKVNRCEVIATRVSGYDYIKPLLFVDENCETTTFAPIKNKVSELINSYKLSGEISNVSVYLRDFEHSKWMGLNANEVYHPASLIKVPILIAVLRMTEDNPGLLDKEIMYDDIPKNMIMSRQNYVAKSITLGKKYTVRELLRYMISFSDNNAQLLLIKHLKPTNFDLMFTDLGIGLPMDQNEKQILISAKDYSAFIKTLFNASYLNPSQSEFALSLMRDCSFEDGFLKGLPDGTKVVHKFGEWDNKKDFELHESGVIYIYNKAYLLTIMTKGNSREKLPGVIAAITKTVYDKLDNLARE